jgi:hypothetical protein
MSRNPRVVALSGLLFVEHFGGAQSSLRRRLVVYCVLLAKLRKLVQQIPLPVAVLRENIALEVPKDRLMVNDHIDPPRQPLVPPTV